MFANSFFENDHVRITSSTKIIAIFLLFLIHVFAPCGVVATSRNCDSVTNTLTVVNESFTDVLFLRSLDGCDVFVSSVQAKQIVLVASLTTPIVRSGATRIRIHDVTCISSPICVSVSTQFDAPGAQIVIKRVKFGAAVTNPWVVVGVPLGFKNIDLFSVSECSLTWSAPAVVGTSTSAQIVNCVRGFEGVKVVEIISNTITVTSSVFNPTLQIVFIKYYALLFGVQQSTRLSFNHNKIIMTAPTTDVGVGLAAEIVGGPGLAINNVDLLEFQNNEISLKAMISNTGTENMIVAGLEAASFNNSYIQASSNILGIADSTGAAGGLIVILVSCASSLNSSFFISNNTLNSKFTSTGATESSSYLSAFLLRFTGAVSQLSSAMLVNNNILLSGAPSSIWASFFLTYSNFSNIGNTSVSESRIQTTSTVNSSLQVLTALIFFFGKVDQIQNINCSQSSIFIQSASPGLQVAVGVSFQAVATKVNSVVLESCQFEYWAEVGSSGTTTASSILSATDVEIRNIIARNCDHFIKYSGNGNPQAVVIFISTILQGVDSIFLNRNEAKVSIEKSSVGAVQITMLFVFGSKLFGIENSSAPFNAALERRPLFPINITINNTHVIFSNPQFSVSSLLAAVFFSNSNTPSASFFISNNKVDSYCAYLNGTGGEISTAIAFLSSQSSQSGADSPLEFQLTSNEVISRGIYSEGAIFPAILQLQQSMKITGKILVRNNSIDVDFSAPNLGGLYSGLVKFTGPVLMKGELYMCGNKFVATFCADPSSKAGNIVVTAFMVSLTSIFVDTGAALRVVGDFVQINGQPAKNGWSAAMMVSFDNPIFSQNDRVDFPIHLENCTLIGNIDENFILHNTQGFNTKSLSQYELMYGNMQLSFLRFAARGGIATATTISAKLISNRIQVVRCAVSEKVVIRFATFTQSFLAVSSVFIFNNSISVPTSASLFNPTTTSPSQPNIISRLFNAEVVSFDNYDNLLLKSAPKILNNKIEVSRTGYTASSLVYPTSDTKYDSVWDPWNRVTIVSFTKAAPFSISTPFEICGNKITTTMEEANYIELHIAKIRNMDLTISNDYSPALLMESNVIEIEKLVSFYHESWSLIFSQISAGADSVKIKRSNNNYATPVFVIHNNSLVVSSFVRGLDGTCAIFLAVTDSFSLVSIAFNNNFLSIQSIIVIHTAPVRPQIGIMLVVSLQNTLNQNFVSVQNLEVQNNFVEFGSCSAPNSSGGLCEIATVTMTPSRNFVGSVDSSMSVGKNAADGNIISGTLFLSAFANNTIKLINNNNGQSGPIINSTEFYCFAIRVEYIYSVSGACNIFGNRISLVSSLTVTNNNNDADQRNSIHSSNSQIGIVSFSKCLNDCFIKNNTVETSGIYFLWSSPSNINFFIAQMNVSTREFIPGLQQHNFIFENNSMKISTTSSNNNNNIRTSVLRLFDAPPTRLMLISSSSISFDPTIRSSSVNPISILLLRNEIYSIVFTLQSTSPNIFSMANQNDGIVNFLYLSTEGSVDLEEFRILASLNNNTEVSGSCSMSAMIGINRRNVSVDQLQQEESQLAQERKSKMMKNLASSSSFSLSGNRLIKWPLKPNKSRASSIVDVTARGTDDVLIPTTKYSSALVQDSFWTFGCNYWTSDIQREFSLHTLFEMDNCQFKFNCSIGPSFSFSENLSESPSKSQSPSQTPSNETSTSLSMLSESNETESISPTIPPPTTVSHAESPPVGLLATVAIVAAASLDPSSAAYMNRMLMLTTACGENDPHLPPLTIQSNPTTISLGSPHDDSSDYRGCVLGNSVLIVGVACFCAFIVAPFIFQLNNAIYDRNVKRGVNNKKRIRFNQFSEAAAKIKFPGILFAPTRILLSPTVFAIGVMIGLYFYTNPTPLEISKRNIFDNTDVIRKSYAAPNLVQNLAFCLAFVVFILVPTFGLGLLSKKFGQEEELEERNEFFHAASKGMCPSISEPSLRLLAPIRIWCPTSQNAMHYGMMFMGVSKPWFVVFDLTTDAVIALVNGIAAMTPNKSSCEAARFISLIACIVHFLVLLKVRPHLARFSTIKEHVMSLSSVVLASMTVAAWYKPRNALLGATNNFLIFAAVTAVISAMESILRMTFTWYITNRVLPRLQEKAAKRERKLEREKKKQENELQKMQKQQEHQERKNERQKQQQDEKIQRETSKKKFEDLKSRFMKMLGEGHGRVDHDDFDDDNTLELQLLPQDDNNNVQPNFISLQEDEKDNSTLVIINKKNDNDLKSNQQARSNSSNGTKKKKIMKKKRKNKPSLKSVNEIRDELDDDFEGAVAVNIPSITTTHDDDDDNDDEEEEDLAGKSLTQSEIDRLLGED